MTAWRLALMNKPKIKSAVNAPLGAMVITFCRLFKEGERNPGHGFDYAYVRDEWRSHLEEPGEDFAAWLDYAMALPQFKAVSHRTFFECGMLSRTRIYIDQMVDLTVNEEGEDGISVPW